MNKNKIVVKVAKNNEKYLVVKSKNNETLVTSETYKSNQGVKKAIANLKKVIPDAVVVELSIKPVAKKKKA